MIEFDGYLSGSAEKHFHKKTRVFGQKLLGCCLLLILPGVLSFALRLKDWDVVVAFASIIICVWLCTLIPKSKKERKGTTPKKIFIEDGYIVCVTEKYTEARLIKDVKLVKDFGEYYVLCFPFGKLSDNFVCQKNLLTIGSIQEFENLFDNKITKMNSKGYEDGSLS